MTSLTSDNILPYTFDAEFDSEPFMPGAWIDSVYPPLQVLGSPASVMPESQPSVPPAGGEESPRILTALPEEPAADEVALASNSPHPPPAELPPAVSLAVDSPHLPVQPTEPPAEEIPSVSSHLTKPVSSQESLLPLSNSPPRSQSAQGRPTPLDSPPGTPETQLGNRVHSSVSDDEALSPGSKARRMAARVMRLAEEALSKYPDLQALRQAASDEVDTRLNNPGEEVEDQVKSP